MMAQSYSPVREKRSGQRAGGCLNEVALPDIERKSNAVFAAFGRAQFERRAQVLDKERVRSRKPDPQFLGLLVREHISATHARSVNLHRRQRDHPVNRLDGSE